MSVCPSQLTKSVVPIVLVNVQRLYLVAARVVSLKQIEFTNGIIVDVSFPSQEEDINSDLSADDNDVTATGTFSMIFDLGEWDFLIIVYIFYVKSCQIFTGFMDINGDQQGWFQFVIYLFSSFALLHYWCDHKYIINNENVKI